VSLLQKLFCFEISIELNTRNTVFNTNIEEFPLEIIHFILLFTNYYIHCCKWSNHLPTTETLKCKLKSREKIEKINALLTDTITKHETYWSKFT
jgi:hypothetical protein